jgi:hypothetical protein
VSSVLPFLLLAPLLIGALWCVAARTRMRPAVAAPKRFFVRYYEPLKPAA